jgi:acetyl-CoA acetyltransferase
MATATDVDLMGNFGFQFKGAYAMTLRKYMEKYGWKQKHFAMVTSKNKCNGSLNPNAQYQKPICVAEILNSRMIAWPITLYMCSTMADGATDVIVCATELVEKLTIKTPIHIAACGLRSGEVTEDEDGQSQVACETYELAGIGPEDIEVAEVHDAMAPGEMFRIEKLGFFSADAIGSRVDDGYFSLSGKLPVNPSGGLAARGHPIGATGLAQIAELVWQMRGEAGRRQVGGQNSTYPKIGLAQNSGGYLVREPRSPRSYHS